jgi:penicillin-binding protein 1C
VRAVEVDPRFLAMLIAYEDQRFYSHHGVDFLSLGRAARDMVIDRVFARGIISQAERDAAKREALPRGRRACPVLAAHASEEEVRREPEKRLHRLTLDAKLQASLETLTMESASSLGPKLSCAILVIDNASGEILARVGSADYFSQERAGSIDMTLAIRSPGSALKPFIYALAFDAGIAHPETLLDDRPRHYGSYAPENFDLSFQGTVTARQALQMSLNVPAVALLDEIGPAQFIAHLRNAGAKLEFPDDTAPGLAAGLGGLGITLHDLVKLYAGLAPRFGGKSARCGGTGFRRAPDSGSRRKLLCRRYFARRTAAAKCAFWAYRLQNRDVLWLSRCFCGWL